MGTEYLGQTNRHTLHYNRKWTNNPSSSIFSGRELKLHETMLGLEIDLTKYKYSNFQYSSHNLRAYIFFRTACFALNLQVFNSQGIWANTQFEHSLLSNWNQIKIFQISLTISLYSFMKNVPTCTPNLWIYTNIVSLLYVFCVFFSLLLTGLMFLMIYQIRQILAILHQNTCFSDYNNIYEISYAWLENRKPSFSYKKRVRSTVHCTQILCHRTNWTYYI